MTLLSTQKRLFIGLSTLAFAGLLPFASEPVRAQLIEVTESIVEAVRQPEIQLTLTAEKQIIEVDIDGQEKISWESLENKAQVQPNDVLRYTVDGSNSSDIEAKNLNITQPIPVQMTYMLDSAVSSDEATLTTYSIDNGDTFVEEPMVEVVLNRLG
ncbi:MAG: hypothetical protein F6K42_35495 [Leptolyngbya sp. SIO1D8]|nr:hypothetical protein [Leptolyngbya sp. SIO1D8]